MALDPVAFKRYLDEKYPNQEELNAIAYYETKEIRDDFNRLVFPGGLKVDELSIMHPYSFLSLKTPQASLSLQSLFLVLMHKSTLLSVQATRL